MQGRLIDPSVSVELTTVCAHCDRPLHIGLDSNLAFEVHNKGASPMLFEPQVDWRTFEEPNIIDAY